MLKLKPGIGMVTALMLMAMPAPAVGHDLDTTSHQKNEVMQEAREAERNAPVPVKEMKTQVKSSLKEEAKVWVSKRLDASQKRRCQARHKVIDGYTKSSTERARRRMQYFDSVVVRVEEFVSKHSLDVTDYDHIRAEIEGSKTAANDALARSEQARTLNCDGEDPKGEVEAFKSSIHSLISALKNYRDDIKVLIKAVHKSSDGSRL